MTDVQIPVGGKYDLGSKYDAEEGRIFLTGLQALVRVVVDQMRTDKRNGLRTRGFVSGYPGSPLAGLDLELEARAKLLEEHGIVHKPGLNEELAATAVMGSQIAMRLGKPVDEGVVGIWYGKAPGVDRATDAIRLANYYGTTRHGGVLALVGDDPTSKSSTTPSSSDGLLAELALPILYPGTVQEVLDFGAHGIAMSRASGLWTALKVVTQVADGSGTAFVAPGRVVPTMPLGADGEPLGRHEPASLSPPQIIAVERDLFDVRLPAALAYARENALNEITASSNDDWFGIVAPGHVYYEVVTALRKLGIEEADLSRRGIRLLRLGLINPLDPDLIRTFAGGLREVMVVEDKRGRLESLVRDALYGTPNAPVIVGKTAPDGTSLLPTYGGIDADTVLPPLRDRLAQRIPEAELGRPAEILSRPVLPLLPRTPYFCSGCPHNSSLRVPDGATVGAGIGCHSMVAFMAPNVVGQVSGVTQMGGEGAQWIGAEPFVENDHIFQNLGEGTFFHSGEMAIRAAIASGTHITYKILYNRAVAMTGGQEAVGLLDVPSMARWLDDVGVAKIIITTEDKSRYRHASLPRGIKVLDRNDIIEAQEELRATPGVTALIHDQQCAAEARRLRKRGKQVEPKQRVMINERVCEGCGDCGAASNCLSVRPIDTDLGSKTVIDQSSCNKDFSCMKGDCPSFVTIEPNTGWLAKWRAKRTAAVPAPEAAAKSPAAELPEWLLDGYKWPAPPPGALNPDDVAVRMPGVGGTGVVTVAQVLGTAALLDGKYVTGLDQTGLAQKGGAVISDVHISTEPIAASSKVTAGGVDLLLAFDLIVALTPSNLTVASPERTIVVASTTVTPTGQMIGTGSRQPEVSEMIEQLQRRSRADVSRYVDMAAVALDLFGNSLGANIFGLGVAFQLGALPVAAESIERAIELNGVAVQANVRAFRAGRAFVVVPDEVEQARAAARARKATPDENAIQHEAGALHAIGSTTLGGELGALAVSRAVDLVDYQDAGYARQYLRDVEAVATAEQKVTPGSTVLSIAVARYLYKLMAYKDEYEVARLHLSEAADAQVASIARGQDVKVVWHLHPPILRAMGMDSKLALGPWFRPVFVALRAMKRLRGTPFDLFGYAKVRKVERQLIKDYRRWLKTVPSSLNTENLATAVEIASAPDQVRGYEFIKLANVEQYERTRNRLIERYKGAKAAKAS